MKQKINVEEINLIKNWQEKPDDNIALYFFNKYKEDILSINYSKIKLKFSSIPLEREDFFFEVWKSVNELLKEYDVKKAGSFKNLLIRKTYLASIKEALKFINNSHIVLNNAYSYERVLQDKSFKLAPSGKIYLDQDYQNKTREFINLVVSFNERFPSFLVKRVIYLKSLGYGIVQISKRLRRSKKEIEAVVKYICKIAKKLYH